MEEEVWSVSPATRGVGIRGGVSHDPESGSGIRGRMDSRRCCVHWIWWSVRVWQRCSVGWQSGGGKGGAREPVLLRGRHLCAEVTSAHSRTLSAVFLSLCLFKIGMYTFYRIACCCPLQQDTEIWLKEPQVSGGNERVFIIVSLASDPE